MSNLPKWLALACQNQVLTLRQAQQLDRLILEAERRPVELPKSLHKALDRLYLWELPASPTQH
jgi:hypothetical protein